MKWLKNKLYRLGVFDPFRITLTRAGDDSSASVTYTVKREVNKFGLFFYCLMRVFTSYKNYWYWYKPWQIFSVLRTIAKDIKAEMKKPPTTFPGLHLCLPMRYEGENRIEV